MSERIDAHHHLWRYRKEDYGWIGPGMEVIARDFLPANLAVEMRRVGIAGSVAVQARQSLDETNWLLSLAAENEFIRGVVGWAPIATTGFAGMLEKLVEQKKLKGLRHVIQDEPDENFINGTEFNAGIARLAATGLVYDILIFERHLPAAIAFVDQHPKQIFVLDHIAKPRIKDRLVEPWRSRIVELAKRDNVYCKLSGMVTETNQAQWMRSDLQPYFDTVLKAFGPGRLMFGSDWPVCLLACTYSRWHETVLELTEELSSSEKELVFGRVATKVYSLKNSTPGVAH